MLPFFVSFPAVPGPVVAAAPQLVVPLTVVPTSTQSFFSAATLPPPKHSLSSQYPSQWSSGFSSLLPLVAGKVETQMDVYGPRLEEGFATMMAKIREGFCYVALDTEFPGVCVAGQNNNDLFGFDVVSRNANMTSLIEVGFSLFDHCGQRPAGVHTFVFHFQWQQERELFNSKSIALLKRSGINFTRNALEGMRYEAFAELFALYFTRNPRIVFITFHGSHDVAYLMRLAMRSKLSSSLAEFKRNVAALFPSLVDVKVLAEQAGVMGGLESLATALGVERVGKSHNSGSDAHLTGECFFKGLHLWHDSHRALNGVIFSI